MSFVFCKQSGQTVCFRFVSTFHEHTLFGQDGLESFNYFFVTTEPLKCGHEDGKWRRLVFDESFQLRYGQSSPDLRQNESRGGDVLHF